jgi:hypothetical protein
MISTRFFDPTPGSDAVLRTLYPGLHGGSGPICTIHRTYSWTYKPILHIIVCVNFQLWPTATPQLLLLLLNPFTPN